MLINKNNHPHLIESYYDCDDNDENNDPGIIMFYGSNDDDGDDFNLIIPTNHIHFIGDYGPAIKHIMIENACFAVP